MVSRGFQLSIYECLSFDSSISFRTTFKETDKKSESLLDLIFCIDLRSKNQALLYVDKIFVGAQRLLSSWWSLPNCWKLFSYENDIGVGVRGSLIVILDLRWKVRGQMNFATKCNSWKHKDTLRIKYTLTVTKICYEVILRSLEVTDCPEHALVKNLFVANIRRLETDRRIRFAFIKYGPKLENWMDPKNNTWFRFTTVRMMNSPISSNFKPGYINFQI